jgi:hypothetical protein
MMRPLTYERRWYKKKLPTTRARGKRRERGRRDRARGETTREMRAGRNDGCGENRVAFFLGDALAARSGGARWRDSRFLDLFFVVVFELSLKVMDEKSVVVSFSRETKLTDENVPPPPLDANSQVEEETNPQIETQAQKDAHEIEVIFLTQNERKRFQNR